MSVAIEVEELTVLNNALYKRVEALEVELAILRKRIGVVPTSKPQQVATSEKPAACESGRRLAADGCITCPSDRNFYESSEHGLTTSQVARYSRHLILPSFGAKGQSRLSQGSALVVGAGGLGSPACLYLAAMGVGRIGIVDQDVVEMNNLHRQIIHREEDIGLHKAVSAAAACRRMNSSIQVDVHPDGFKQYNALDLIGQYDVVVDATDNAPTRYLISDACVAANKPLVSGAAIGTDGQLTVYNYGDDGPCYRCLFPQCPPPQSCSRCCDAGVLGGVPGVIGTLQALEAVKILSGTGSVMSQRLLLADFMAGRFQSVKIRSRRPDCICCGDSPAITAATLSGYDYSAFTGQATDDDNAQQVTLLPDSERITALQLLCELQRHDHHLIIDTRPPEQFDIARLPGSINIPLDQFDQHLDRLLSMLPSTAARSSGAPGWGQPLEPSHGKPLAAGEAEGRLQADELSQGNPPDVSGGEDRLQPDELSQGNPPDVSGGEDRLQPDELSQGNPPDVSEGQDRLQPDELSRGNPPNELPGDVSSGSRDEGPDGMGQQANGGAVSNARSVFVVCRRGNDSQFVVQRLRALGITSAVDLVGGLTAWSREADASFPEY